MATAATALVALLAAVFAYFQVKEARKLRWEQAQPFVVVDLLPNSYENSIIEISISNVGNTLARNVTFSFDPQIEISQERYNLADSVLFTEGIPSLPPGKEIRFIFDVGHQRFDSDLPNTYRITVNCEDAKGTPLPTLEYICDLELYMSLHTLGIRNIHHLAKNVEKIAKTLDGWTEDQTLSVISYEGWEWRDRRNRDMEETLQRRRENVGENNQ